MKEKESKAELLPPEVVLAAVEGDTQAILQVLNHYETLIEYKLNERIKKLNLNPKIVPIEDMKQEVLILLILAIRKMKF